MRATVSTACQTFQATLRSVWSSGSTYAEMTAFLGVTRDQIIRLRDRLQLPLRLDRRTRKKGKRHADPSARDIAQACREIQAQWDDATREDRLVTKSAPFRVQRIELTDEARDALGNDVYRWDSDE